MGNDWKIIIFNDFYIVQGRAGLKLEELVLLLLFYGYLAKVKIALGDAALRLECLEGDRDMFLLELSDGHLGNLSTKIELANTDSPARIGGK